MVGGERMLGTEKRLMQLNEILHAVRAGDEGQLLKMIREIRAVWQKEEPDEGCSGRTMWTEEDGWKDFLIQLHAVLLFSLYCELPEGRIRANLERAQEYAGRIRNCGTALDYGQLLEEMIQWFGSCYQKEQKSVHSFLVRRVLQTVDTDPSQTLTLQYFAESLGVNRSYLSALFRRETGKTLTEYVTEQRIRYAARLLAETSCAVDEAARKSGIPDSHYFSRLFKKRMGKTPSEYRLECRMGILQ